MCYHNPFASYFTVQLSMPPVVDKAFFLHLLPTVVTTF